MVFGDANSAAAAAALPGTPGLRTAAEHFVLLVPAIVVFALTVFGERLVIDRDAF